MEIGFVPYAILLASVVACFSGRYRLALVLIGLGTICGLWTGGLTILTLPPILLLGGSLWLATKPSVPRVLQAILYGIFSFLALALASHLLPGFRNLKIFDKVQFSADSVPFTMYLNFDKTLVGVFLLIFFIRPHTLRDRNAGAARQTGWILLILVSLLLPLCLMIGYARVDPKWPPVIWIINNLFFVCVAEESLFRGFVQKGLSRILPDHPLGKITSLVTAALLFGLAHFRGGWAYVALASMAGLFYGYAYMRTNKIESAIVTHFGLNLVHISLFSYPALATGPSLLHSV
ncbi:MAG: CPBP family intramembrane glutamic endopeptidase [Bdellovibrionales bacterium]